MTSSLATGDRLPDDAHETARDRITKTILRRGRACRVFACPPLATGTTTLDRSNWGDTGTQVDEGIEWLELARVHDRQQPLDRTEPSAAAG